MTLSYHVTCFWWFCFGVSGQSLALSLPGAAVCLEPGGALKRMVAPGFLISHDLMHDLHEFKLQDIFENIHFKSV